MRFFYTLLLASLFSVGLAAQCYKPQDLDTRMQEADLAVVGAVINSVPFYNEYGEIYTMHDLRVDRMAGPFQASLPPDTIQFFTMGGAINEEKLVVYPSLRDITDAQGVFLLNEYNGDRVASEGVIYRPTAVHESVMPFDPQSGTFSDGDSIIGGITEINVLIEETMGVPLTNVTDTEWQPQPVLSRSMMPVVSSISPLNVSAGIGDIITVSGSAFGNTQGSIFFDNPDDGPGGSFTGAGNEDILSWTDTQIRVRVISNGGGGRIIVRTSAGQQVTSSQSINVDFAITNLNLTNGSVVTPLLIDDEADGNGGYIFNVSSSNANDGVSLADSPAALAALNRAVTTWQQDGDYSVYLGGTTSIQTPSRDDDVNIVAFGSNAYDFDVELGSGTVGIAFSYYNACGSSEFETTGFDILFRRPGNPNGFGGSVNYNFGPGGGSGTDFESVALHEFGHTHQLKHVSDPSEVMSFRITNGQTQRILSVDTRNGADFVADLSQAYDPPIINCGPDFNAQRDYLTFSEAGGVSLPVEWLSFSARPTAKTVELEWSTAAENGNDFFGVERSTDGRNFMVIDAVDAFPAAQTNGAVYEYTDENPLDGVSYYRITQVDFSGASSSTPIERVFRDVEGDLIVFPNPVVNVLNVNNGVDAGHYTITDLNGRVIRTFAARENQEILRVNVSDLQAGQYVLRAGDGRVTRFVR